MTLKINFDALQVVIEALAEEDGGGYLATVPALPGCMSDGETRAEALTNLEGALIAWCDAASQMGRMSATKKRSHALS